MSVWTCLPQKGKSKRNSKKKRRGREMKATFKVKCVSGGWTRELSSPFPVSELNHLNFIKYLYHEPVVNRRRSFGFLNVGECRRVNTVNGS